MLFIENLITPYDSILKGLFSWLYYRPYFICFFCSFLFFSKTVNKKTNASLVLKWFLCPPTIKSELPSALGYLVIGFVFIYITIPANETSGKCRFPGSCRPANLGTGSSETWPCIIKYRLGHGSPHGAWHHLCAQCVPVTISISFMHEFD